MDRAGELCIKFFLILIFWTILLFLVIQMIASLLQAIASFVLAILPVLMVAVLAIGIPVVLYRIYAYRSGRSGFSRRNRGASLLGNAAIRRPRGRKGRDDDD